MGGSTSRSCQALRCPRCGEHLVNTTDHLNCPRQHRFPIIDGIPVFLKLPGSENDQTIERLEGMICVAEERGWRAALELLSEDPGNVRYVTDESRASFLNLIPINRSSMVLEVGCSLGQITERLCRKSRVVHAMDVVPQQARFAKLRCEQSGFNNASIVCGGDDCLLPYANDLFDCVIVNLVLEWCGMRANGSPLENQRLFLRECTRVLKDDGYLFVATKNRFSVKYLMGRPDVHAWGMRFGNALPRWLMKFLLRISARPAPRSMLFSFRSLKNEILSSGYTNVQAFWAIPDPRYPIDYVKFDYRSIKMAKNRVVGVDQLNRTTQVLFHLPRFVLPYLAEGLVFLSQKRPAGS